MQDAKRRVCALEHRQLVSGLLSTNPAVSLCSVMVADRQTRFKTETRSRSVETTIRWCSTRALAASERRTTCVNGHDDDASTSRLSRLDRPLPEPHPAGKQGPQAPPEPRSSLEEARCLSLATRASGGHHGGRHFLYRRLRTEGNSLPPPVTRPRGRSDRPRARLFLAIGDQAV